MITSKIFDTAARTNNLKKQTEIMYNSQLISHYTQCDKCWFPFVTVVKITDTKRSLENVEGAKETGCVNQVRIASKGNWTEIEWVWIMVNNKVLEDGSILNISFLFNHINYYHRQELHFLSHLLSA